MFEPELFATSFARALHVMRAKPRVVDQQKAALRALHSLTTMAPATLRLRDGHLAVDGGAVSAAAPHVAELVAQLAAHGVAEITIAREAAPGDLLVLLRALAPERGDVAGPNAVQGALREWGAASITVAAGPDAEPEVARPRSSQVLQVQSLDPANEFASWSQAPVDDAPQDDSWAGPGLREIDLGFTAEEPLLPVAAPEPPVAEEPSPPAAFEETAVPAVTLPVPGDTALARALGALLAEPFSPRALDLLTAFAAAFRDAVAGEDIAVAVRAAAAVVELEPAAPAGTPHNSYAIVLNRMLPREVLAQVAPLLLVPAEAPFATAVLQRAGAPAVDILLGLLAAAESIRERKAYMTTLRGMPSGTDQVLHMLAHPQWYVVRNVADLCGMLKLEAAVPDLAGLLGHSDARVQRAAAVALARIGTIDTVAPLLELIRQPKPDVRRAIAAALVEAPALASLPVLTALAADGDKAVAGAARDAIDVLRQQAATGRPGAGR